MISHNDIAEWYNKRHVILEEKSWRPYKAYPIFLDYLNIPKEYGKFKGKKILNIKKMLDIGCGTGYLLKAAHNRGLETYGVDISKEGIRIAKKVSPESEISIGKGEELKFADNFFDYVTNIGALEHFIDIKKGVREMKRVGNNNAKFCVVVPNKNYLFWKLGFGKGTEQQDINENLFSLKLWKRLFSDEGLEIVNVHEDNWFRKCRIFSTLNPFGIIKRVIFKAMLVIIPLNYTYQFVFILKKKGK